ncbi:hypothetical protein PS2_031700 [Malus domestica]
MRVGHVWIGSVVFGIHLDPRSSLLRLLVNGFSPGHTALHYFGACYVVKHDNQASHSGHRFPFIISNDCKATVHFPLLFCAYCDQREPVRFFSSDQISDPSKSFHFALLASIILPSGILWIEWFHQGSSVVMVCQGASQTKFRALKHENGMAGRPTIIVRVIACFQPLQDCQVSIA